MSRTYEICERCGNGRVWPKDKQCDQCDENDARAAREQESDVIELDAVETLEEMKQWIKEHLIK